jgi:hypothetical protein
MVCLTYAILDRLVYQRLWFRKNGKECSVQIMIGNGENGPRLRRKPIKLEGLAQVQRPGLSSTMDERVARNLPGKDSGLVGLMCKAIRPSVVSYP